MNRKHWKSFSAVSVCLIILLMFIPPASTDESFDVVRVGNILSFCENSFTVSSPESGLLKITIHDNVCVYRTITRQIAAGETRIVWDGCGFNEERLYPKYYMITCELSGESGKEYIKSFQSPIEFTGQKLQYALPSSDILYLDKPESWFIEYKTVMKGIVHIDFIPLNDNGQACSYRIQTAGGKISKLAFSDFAGKNLPQQGQYTVSLYEETKKDDSISFPLRVLRVSPEPSVVQPTGDIMPDRSMSDSEIWEIMMKPSVVVDIDFFKHQAVFEKPDAQSRTLGTLHGQTQCLKVILTEENWALIGAWNHEDAGYMEGWVPLDKLKVTEPQTEYGILIDKKYQTLSLYREGRLIDKILVSTGRPDFRKLYQETAAGCFLTGYHRVNFSMNGKKYDYVIQYDGGNLLHQTPYDWGSKKKDFTYGRGYLGAKASHACVRIQAEPGEGGINAYWIWTHIPYHTRVVVLDDPDERIPVMEKLSYGKEQTYDVSEYDRVEKIELQDEQTVTLTFGGAFIPGGKSSINSRKDSFVSFVREEGADKPLKNLYEFFRNDDCTCVFLGCAAEKKDGAFSEEKGIEYMPADLKDIIPASSIEMIQITDDRVYAYSDTVVQETEQSLSDFATVTTRNMVTTVMLQGRLFGFASCSENDYLKDPGIISKLITELKTLKCDRIIMLYSWGNAKEDTHSIVQEAMARRSVLEGADLVVGSHPGSIQGIDYIRDVPVVYSMGDLLIGNIVHKPKDQQGILVRADFSFGEENTKPVITVVPILPYGSNGEQNNYLVTAQLPSEQAIREIRHIQVDSTDDAMKKTRFYLPEAK